MKVSVLVRESGKQNLGKRIVAVAYLSSTCPFEDSLSHNVLAVHNGNMWGPPLSLNEQALLVAG